ncbi:hypothetical protein EXIGLDRAFT_778695 [Exidia glandulosa HHB12029]|uniref:GH18 domain-containing protein n=1 Tax=Exidia glandulosa HHB12029 TaxID=1314781 RepID=A0A165CEP7_EXIGL|nr:hypothetical protein EXIGLDRAFT_778695 [Exidia glandulosa HHB12029]
MAQPKQHPLVGFMALPEFFSDAVDMIASLSDDWDVVNLLWAEPTAAPGIVALSTCRQEPCQSEPDGSIQAFISAVKRRVQSGRTVQICVNCLQGVPSSNFSILSLDSQEALDGFVQSVQDIVGGFGFNGVYIDVEVSPDGWKLMLRFTETLNLHFSARIALPPSRTQLACTASISQTR